MNKLSKKLDKNNLPYVEGVLSIIANILLFGLKYWAGIVSGSIAIMADAWHTLSDSLSSVIVLLGTKFSKKPADKDHPFGHGRADLIAAFIIGIMLLLVSFDFMLKSYVREKCPLRAPSCTTIHSVLCHFTNVQILAVMCNVWCTWRGCRKQCKSWF